MSQFWTRQGESSRQMVLQCWKSVCRRKFVWMGHAAVARTTIAMTACYFVSWCVTKQSCSKMAWYRWIKTESRWNKKLISLSSPDWSASLRPSLERKTGPDALIGPNESTATGWKNVMSPVVWIFRSLTSGCLFCCWSSFTSLLLSLSRHWFQWHLTFNSVAGALHTVQFSSLKPVIKSVKCGSKNVLSCWRYVSSDGEALRCAAAMRPHVGSLWTLVALQTSTSGRYTRALFAATTCSCWTHWTSSYRDSSASCSPTRCAIYKISYDLS